MAAKFEPVPNHPLKKTRRPIFFGSGNTLLY
jgi:hypothetical protein